MNKEKIIFIAAILSGFLAFALVYRQINEAKKPAYSVAIATKDLTAGSVITEEMVKMSSPIKNLDPANFYLQKSDTMGLVLKADIGANKGIQRSLVEKDVPAGDGVIQRNVQGEMVIPPGLNVVSFSNQEVEDPVGFVKEGSYVDILGRSSDQSTTYTILVYSAPVLQLSRAEEGGAFLSISLGLTPEEAEILTSGVRRSRLRVAGRTGPGPKFRPEVLRDSIELIRGSEPPVKVVIGATQPREKKSSPMEVVANAVEEAVEESEY